MDVALVADRGGLDAELAATADDHRTAAYRHADYAGDEGCLCLTSSQAHGPGFRICPSVAQVDIVATDWRTHPGGARGGLE